MIDAARAEATKLSRHRATWLMVWIYPIVFILFILVQVGGDMMSSADSNQAVAAAQWIDQSCFIWGAPLSIGGRFLIAGFAAVVFAGEYSWNTWKLVIPARARWQLIAAKWLVSMLLIFAAFVAADILGLLGSLLRPVVGGPAIPAAVTFSEVAAAHAAAAAHAVLPTLYMLAWAGFFAVLTTSVLATVTLSVALVLLEQLLLPIGLMAFGYAPTFTSISLHILPFYHMANLIAWSKGTVMELALGVNASIAATHLVSLTTIFAWIGGLGAATVFHFSRQDLN